MHTGCYHGSILLQLECDSFLEMLDFSTILLLYDIDEETTKLLQKCTIQYSEFSTVET